MNEHFLTDIEIKQFKCFTDFKAAGFKRVNLIGGKNNIGKTAFMEACWINVHSVNINTMMTAIHGIKYKRENINLINKNIDHLKLLDATKNYTTKSNINDIDFSFVEKDATKIYHLNNNGELKSINAKDLTFIFDYVDNIEFIDNFGWSDSELIDAYQAIQKQDQENKLNAYISIICALYACKNGYLFIDEIDNGIHYTQLDRLWELILTLSKQTNCQVFAITHSKEMLESFARVAKKLKERDISYTTIVKNKQQEIKSITRDYEMLLDSIEQEREVRGC